MLFDSTVRRELARGFGATLIVILTVVIAMTLPFPLRLAASGRIAPEDVVLMLSYFALKYAALMMTLSLFITVVVSLGRMYRDSEMAIWFSSGVGLSRFIRPVMRTAWPVLLAASGMLLFVWPWCNRSIVEMQQRYEQRSDLSRMAPGVFQTSRDGSRVFFVDRASREGGDAHNVFILADKKGDESVTSARTGHIEKVGQDQVLVLEHGQRNEMDATTGRRSLASFEDYRVVVADRNAREADTTLPRTLYTPELMRDPSRAARGELAWRFGMVLAGVNLLLLGIGLSATNPRRASNWNLLFALLAFLVYFNMVNLSQAWINNGKYAMAPLMITLHGGIFVLALGLIWWRDHGAIKRLFWHRAAA